MAKIRSNDAGRIEPGHLFHDHFAAAREAMMIPDDDPDLFNWPPPSTPPEPTKLRPKPSVEIPFMQRPTCTIKEACKASGMGRTKFYELINGGELKMISVGRRRLVQVPSLLKFLRVEDNRS
jgi:excisionase family DNA binding protein